MPGLYCYRFDGHPLAERGNRTLAGAKRRIKELAKTGAPGRYWVEQDDVPLYGVHAWDEPKTERVPLSRVTLDADGHAVDVTPTGFTTRTVPGQTQRRIKPGNMPWGR